MVPSFLKRGHESYGLKNEDRTNWPKILRLSSGEQLDVVGVTKRLGKREDEASPRYPSVARVAADTWLRGVERRGKLQPLKDACQSLVSKGLNRVREETYKSFPYEGTIVFQDRHKELTQELGLANEDLAEVTAALKKIGGEPNPYLAVLVADGDKMGAAISDLASVDKNREFSNALADFAGEATKIVHEYYGVLVYAGGDDVLAFLPVDQCLACADKLHDDFAGRLGDYGKPTLSVGIGIGHFMENLEDLLGYGRAAEKSAKKPDRNGLAVHLHKRGGSPIRVRSQWTDQPDKRLTRYAELIQANAIPGKLPYDLRKLADVYKDWPPSMPTQAIAQDVVRVIRDKQPSGGQEYMSEIESLVKKQITSAENPSGAENLDRFAKELLVARQIATALRQASGMPESREEVAS